MSNAPIATPSSFIATTRERSEPPLSQMLSRRASLRLVTGAAVIAAAYGTAAGLRRLMEPALTFEPIDGLPGFRRMAGGPVSTGALVFAGLGDPDADAIPPDSLCTHLFAPSRPDLPQIAYFSDSRCIHCRVLSPLLHALETEQVAGITWHELPLLGQASILAARAALAARAQGAYDIFHRRLMGSPILPTPHHLEVLAREAGIDPNRLFQDMQNPTVTQQLATTAALARRFGFIGTPALVVGRTAVLGRVDRRLLLRLIAAEDAAPEPAPCA